MCVALWLVAGPLAGGTIFWDCPVAQAVVGALQQQLVGCLPGVLQPQHVLCMVCPEAVGGGGHVLRIRVSLASRFFLSFIKHGY